MFQYQDVSEYNPHNTDEQKILNDVAVPCRICEAVFLRLRLTMRYCAWYHKGFCEDEHGTFAIRGRGSCVKCGHHA